ncbi:IS200/IS605 family transposase [Rhodopirellula sp. P2]|uniref:IS200/IS605 family transposase n=1 Tax=Rhodopirellula sp. P2 TaxID=2127060 RepID=UPI0023678E7F|nr:IS200/IS605 family transposase [Rhodopirellula sp. P2]WDQ16403.1 IS200/IS605 family transposase [Rhodopirellula sp. P2]WDQ16404.1 IS200/IS605 family transposase [Rhodopirellula sp. P2]WDQ16405.1 IS200/IS605 family transposase [Rhodopirellula sp. P2]
MSTFTNLLFHLIYSTKYRKPAIRSEWQDELHGYLGGIVRDQKGTLLKIGGVEDHVHLLAKLSPTIAISDVLRTIKSNSSKWINERSDVHRKFEWQSGYAAFSVSESQAPAVADYIANQAEHHRKKTFEEEFLSILKRHRIQYDPRYVFEREIIA